MKSKVASFAVDHTTLERGFYLRSVYTVAGIYPLRSYDMRFRAPMEHAYLTPEAIHTIEHLMAHYLREKLGNKVVSFAPMGCKTGFYLIVKGFTSQEKVMEAVAEVCEEQSNLKEKSDVPGLTVEQCGNPELYDIEGSNAALKEYGALLRKLLGKK
ncbi:MAG: S-ribosylhomocysteine lyase [Tidjanibacter sp.]|nr:S-ribosylhomocysteine lyase [Tidjanibacter sp.]MBQ5932001.1 S-ribosylhomocysteine lyase [Tidjanibacter sp.]